MFWKTQNNYSENKKMLKLDGFLRNLNVLYNTKMLIGKNKSKFEKERKEKIENQNFRTNWKMFFFKKDILSFWINLNQKIWIKNL